MPSTANDLPVVFFTGRDEWADWLEQHHADAPGLWLRLAKKASGLASVTYEEAVEVALCYGWIDGQSRSYDETSWVQKFTPRRRGSLWSRINRERAEALIAGGRMRPAGLEAIERARQDGRWDAAYHSSRTAEVPPDLQAALDQNEAARAAFEALDRSNRYAILFRLQTAKRPETRARRLQAFVELLARGEKLHP